MALYIVSNHSIIIRAETRWEAWCIALNMNIVKPLLIRLIK